MYVGTVYNYGHGLVSHSDNLNGNYILYATDGHGDVTDLLNASSTDLDTLEQNQFDAFGNGGANEYSRMGYAGEYHDAETGFIYLRARYYNPAIGRFINEDPLRDGLNWYIYCGNDPVNRHDPDGTFWGLICDVVSFASSVYDVIKNPTDPAAWAGLAGDAVDLLPIVSGVGEAIHIISTVYKSKKALKTVDNIVDAADTVKDVGKAADKAVDSVSDTREFLQDAANKVKTDVTGHVSGTKQHREFEEIIKGSGRTKLKTEASFDKLTGKIDDYGKKGTLRLDVVEYDDAGKIIAVYDLKTGSAKLSQKRIQEIRDMFERTDLPVYEIKPQ
ncbi:MAG: hypothetical protein E7656_09535 [Ruminococcaceae bacterium]|nr:hypothetical protein [Oscillospiraceae bacterium]